MPELPDVEIFRQYLDATALHQRIEDIPESHHKLLRGISRSRLEKCLIGREFESTSRHGKYLFAGLRTGGFLVLHFGMTGFLRYFRDEDKKPGHIRLLIRFDNGFHLAYDCQRKLGRIAYTESIGNFVGEQALGPDALDLCVDFQTFAALFAGRRGMIKSLLMNQRAIAGIGNVYSDEILFQSGIHPKSPVGGLGDRARKKIFRAAREVLRTAIARRVGKKGWPANWLLPRRRPGEPCPKCGGEIVRQKVSGRGSYLCPAHQKG